MTRDTQKSVTVTIKDTARIASIEVPLWHDPSMDGGSFDTAGVEGPCGIMVGNYYNNPTYAIQILLHEIIEGILSNECKRYTNAEMENIFVLDHSDISTLANKLVDGMVSCGLWRIPDRIRFKDTRYNGGGDGS